MKFFYRIFRKKRVLLRKRKQKVLASNEARSDHASGNGEKPAKISRTEEASSTNTMEKKEDSQVRSCKAGIADKNDKLTVPVKSRK
jgi:hypothetical protein